MKNFIKILLLLPLAGVDTSPQSSQQGRELNEQTSYFYYCNGERQYFELNTKHAFVSIADENVAELFAAKKINYRPLKIDRDSC